jgi:hypothetical protein
MHPTIHSFFDPATGTVSYVVHSAGGIGTLWTRATTFRAG